MASETQHLPATGLAREALRETGQFWTPPWVAEAMVSYCLVAGATTLFDPAVGAGAFLQAGRKTGAALGRHVALSGVEIDLFALAQAHAAGLTDEDLGDVRLGDFMLDPMPIRHEAIVANPPYIRHHRLSAGAKRTLRAFATGLLGQSLDGRAGLHVYFLLRALASLAPGGRLAFIIPADTCEGVFAPMLWRWITTRFRLDAVITFAPDASPFPSVDTNPIIVLIRAAEPVPGFFWARCTQSDSPALTRWLGSDLRQSPIAGLEIHTRETHEALQTGLSRAPRTETHEGPRLGEIARVMRGIATGANEFFFLTRAQAAALALPEELLLPAIGRTRDVTEDTVTAETLAHLDHAGRPTLLFAPDGRPLAQFSDAVQRYLQQGAAMDLSHRALIQQRNPWYKMETRRVPPFLFAYLGRRNIRFIRNLAGAMPLTSFLCVYPLDPAPASVERLWRVLQHEDTVANLAQVGKSYGSGAIKVEPRALEQLPLPLHIVEREGLFTHTPRLF